MMIDDDDHNADDDDNDNCVDDNNDNDYNNAWHEQMMYR